MISRGVINVKQLIQSLGAPMPSGPYSQGVRAGNLVFVSGQDGVNPDGSSAGDSMADQAAASLENIKSILAAAGVDLSAIVYMTCHLSDLNHGTVAEFNQVYDNFFKEVEIKPARITVGSQLLDVNVEISAIAVIE